MQYTIASHRTSFRNVMYRSRLEAKWASFFTDLGWQFQYEPFDLKGWTPDFEIMTRTPRRLLVEVKPVTFREESLGKDFEFEETFAKALNHCAEFNILMIGVAPFIADASYESSYCIGFLAGDGTDTIDYAVMKDRYDLSPGIGWWGNWINGEHSKGHRTKDRFNPCYDLEGFWADAHNNTMFDPFRYYKC